MRHRSGRGTVAQDQAFLENQVLLSPSGGRSTTPTPDSRCYPAEINLEVRRQGCCIGSPVSAPKAFSSSGTPFQACLPISPPGLLPLLPSRPEVTFLFRCASLLVSYPASSSFSLNFPLTPAVFSCCLCSNPLPSQHPNPLELCHSTPDKQTPEQVHVCLGLYVLQLRSKPRAAYSV